MGKRGYLVRLDQLSTVLLIIGLCLFVLSAISYIVSVTLLATLGFPPIFTLGGIATILGIGGMIIIPLYITVAVVVNIRERRKKTGNDIDDHPERGAAGSS